MAGYCRKGRTRGIRPLGRSGGLRQGFGDLILDREAALAKFGLVILRGRFDIGFSHVDFVVHDIIIEKKLREANIIQAGASGKSVLEGLRNRSK